MTDRAMSRWPWRLVAVALAAVLVVLLAVTALTGAWRSLSPFGSDTVDRSQPALLQSIRDLSQYHAAVGEFQVVIDVERDVRFVPSVLAGQRTLFVAAGTVNAYVDFAGLADDGLRVSSDRTSVQVQLPRAALDKPNLDQGRSYVFVQQRGAFNRLSDLLSTPDQQPFYVLAEQKLAEAAKESQLTAQAERNTRTMLTGLLQGLGYQVSFVDPG